MKTPARAERRRLGFKSAGGAFQDGVAAKTILPDALEVGRTGRCRSRFKPSFDTASGYPFPRPDTRFHIPRLAEGREPTETSRSGKSSIL
jgi:hypothetical protein